MRTAARGRSRRIVVAALLVVLAGGALLARPWEAPIGPAHAVARSYAERWTGRSAPLQRCVAVEVRGTVAASWRATLGGGTAWSHLRLRDPVLVVAGTAATGTGCAAGRPAALRVESSERWSGDRCGLRVRSSVPEPDGEDAGTPAPSPCPDDRTGSMDAIAGPSTVVTTAASGSPVVFGDAVAPPGGALVLRDAVGLVAHTAGGSDVFGRTVTVRLTR